MSGGMRTGWLQLAFGFESQFALFLFAGVVKSTPAFTWVPVDLTLLALAGSMIAGIISLRQRNWRVSRHACIGAAAMAAFSAIVVISLAWTPGREYAGKKALLVAAMCGWSFCGAALVLAGRPDRLRRLFGAMVVLGVMTAVQVIWLMARDPLVASEEWGRSYLGFGRLFGVASLVVVAWILWSARTGVKWVVAGVSLVILGAGLLVGGGRGPMLAAMAAMAVPVGAGFRMRDDRIYVERRSLGLAVALITLVCLVLALGQAGVFLRTVQRLMVLLTGGDAHSFGQRLWYYQQVPGLWFDAPLVGHGIGSWPLLIGWGDVRAYPHNIVFEIIVELGALGLLAFGIMCAVSIRGVVWLSARSEPHVKLVLMILVSATFNALVSGDLTDNRLLFAVLGLAAGMPRYAVANRG
jgi:hypothetical protein